MALYVRKAGFGDDSSPGMFGTMLGVWIVVGFAALMLWMSGGKKAKKG